MAIQLSEHKGTAQKTPGERKIRRVGVCGSFGGSFALFPYFGGSFWLFGGSFAVLVGVLVGVFIFPHLRAACLSAKQCSDSPCILPP